MNKKIIINFVFLFLTFVLFWPSLLLAIDNSQVLQMSVTVYDPSGPNLSITAIPEKRIPNVSPDRIQNKSTELILKLYPVGAQRTADNVVFSTTTISNDVGKSFNILEGLAADNYDLTVKGYSHLTRLASDVLLDKFVEIDFTNAGLNPLYSGDINLTEGDNKVNALDISILVNNFSTGDNRSDLNQDGVVNSIDISNLLTNFNVIGD